MQPQPTVSHDIREIRSTVTTKGQVTIPLVVRNFLTIKPGDQVVFHLEKEQGNQKAKLSLLPTPTLEETFASVKPVRQPEDFKKLKELALEEKAERELEKMK
jgi:AbrB family looped-hinge helix DNA binding protein